LEIEQQVKCQPDPSKPNNLLLNLNFIEFLQNNFMPYIFIWGGFVFRELDSKDKYGNQLTHVTQGSIEKHFGTIKRDHGHKAMYPAQYANEVVNHVITSCKAVKSQLKVSKRDKSE
jgi:hypothetical protein